MRIKFGIVLGVAVILLSGQRGFTADATTELNALVAKINADLAAGKTTESGLADDLKQFDVLLAEHKDEKTDAVAQILYQEATLYRDVLNDDAKAGELLKQLKTDFKDTQLVANLEKQEAAAVAEEETPDALAVGTKFPDFNKTDVMGQPVSIASHKGRVVLVDFWGTWCGPCLEDVSDIINTYQKHHAQGFDIIGVSVDQDKAQLLSFIKDQDMTWQQIFDGPGGDNTLAAKYGIHTVPATFLLDGEGKIIARDVRGEDLEPAVARALANK